MSLIQLHSSNLVHKYFLREREREICQKGEFICTYLHRGDSKYTPKFALYTIVEVTRAHNIESTDARLNPNTNGEKNVCIHGRKPSAYAVDVPPKGRNLGRWMRAKCLTTYLFLCSHQTPL